MRHYSFRRLTLAILTLAGLAAAPTSLLAGVGDGDRDTDFGTNGAAVWEIISGFFAHDTITEAVVPTDQEIFLVGTRTLNESNLIWRAYDTAGGEIDDLVCEDNTSQIFLFGAQSRGLAAGLSDSGQLLVAGAVTFQGTESTERAFLARFDRAAGGCALDADFAGGGFALFDDLSFCDTESCSVLGLAQIRRATQAVTNTRIILLVRSEVSTFKGRLFLVGLTAAGAIDNGFDGNGVLEILAAGTDGFFGEAHLELDARGRIYVLATPYKESDPTDTDLFLFRYLPGGGLDPSFSGDGVLPLVEALSTDSLAVDLRIASDGTVLVSGATTTGDVSFVRAVTAAGVAGSTLVESLLRPALVASQGNGLMVTSSEFLNASGFDGLRTRRRGFGTSSAFPIDTTWGFGGTADHDFDYDPGSVEEDRPEHLELWAGRPMIAGHANGSLGGEVSYLFRLENAYIFADGFEQARTALWSASVTP